jgi:tetratricopeptide (TPR) repeat protein
MGAIETLDPDRLAEQVERLAHHALHGKVWDKAVSYLYQAGEKDSRRSAYREAVAHFEQALVVLRHVRDLPEVRELEIDIRLELRIVLAATGRREQAAEHLHEAERLATAIGDQHRLGEVLAALANHYWGVADERRAIDSAHRALDIAAALGDQWLRAVTSFFLGRAYYAVGDYARAVELLRQSVIAADEYPPVEHPRIIGYHPSAVGRAYLAICHAVRGEFGQAGLMATEGLRRAEAAVQAWGLIGAYWGVGYSLLLQGRVEPAITALTPALDACEAQAIPLLFPLSAGFLGEAYVLAGRAADALPLLEQAGARAAAMGVRASQPFLSTALAEAWLRTGESATAGRLAHQVLLWCREQTARGDEAQVLRLLGEIAVETDPLDVEQAEAYYRQALALADELGMRPLVAHCHLGLGTLYQKIGRQQQAQAELTTAIEMYRGMEMTFWPERAETALAQVAD